MRASKDRKWDSQGRDGQRESGTESMERGGEHSGMMSRGLGAETSGQSELCI